MKNYENSHGGFPEYILGITKEIWEDRGIATLHHYYSPNIIVRSPSGVLIGNRAVIDATMATLAEFPDRTLLGEDVIWSGSPEVGQLSSHRIFSMATHSGNGMFGKATGKQLGYRIIADCHAINNQINDEWLIRDLGAIVRQLGDTPENFARELIEAEGGAGSSPMPFTPTIDQPGPYLGRGNDNDWGQFYADILARMMAADMAVVPARYDRAVQSEHPGGVTGHGHDAIDQFWMGLRASFPSATFAIHHQIGRDDPAMPQRAALRWSLTGTHDGWGTFGRPTGAAVHVMGACHAEFGALTGGQSTVRREFVLYDEIAVWKQILIATG